MPVLLFSWNGLGCLQPPHFANLRGRRVAGREDEEASVTAPVPVLAGLMDQVLALHRALAALGGSASPLHEAAAALRVLRCCICCLGPVGSREANRVLLGLAHGFLRWSTGAQLLQQPKKGAGSEADKEEAVACLLEALEAVLALGAARTEDGDTPALLPPADLLAAIKPQLLRPAQGSQVAARAKAAALGCLAICPGLQTVGPGLAMPPQ